MSELASFCPTGQKAIVLARHPNTNTKKRLCKSCLLNMLGMAIDNSQRVEFIYATFFEDENNCEGL